ncbi:MAG: glycosyltransferase family 2 protein [Gammaproteobacteria bacterium]
MVIAVVIATRNRIAVTRGFLASLEAQQGRDREYMLRVYACDDGSSDGTAELLKTLSHVTVLQGDGSLYWGGATHLAMTRAIEDRPDYILWANDDVRLLPNAIESMLDDSKRIPSKSCIVAGMFLGTNGEVSYGGYIRRPGWRIAFSKHAPCGARIDAFNGNLVLIPRDIYSKLGSNDPRLRHTLGDVEYGLRNVASGGVNMSSSSIVGYCNRNSRTETWEYHQRFVDRLRGAFGPKGYPVKGWWRMCVRYSSRVSVVSNFVAPYLRILYRAR